MAAGIAVSMVLTPQQWLGQAPFTLVLGAGFFGFFAHTGVLSALESAGIRPYRVVGVSAGSLAGGLWSAGLAATDIERELLALRREDFWDPGLPLGGLLRGRKFADHLSRVLALAGVTRFEQCRYGFGAVVHDVMAWRPAVLDRGLLAPAIQASCTVPGMFRPVRVQRRWLVDGGVSDRPGLCAVATGERILVHHLPSRSPWRRLHGAAGRPLEPAPDRLTLTIPGLPRVTPYQLHRGPGALVSAREHTLQWLQQPMHAPR